ncbi:hypothetical protein M0813_12201 [Anaeramoeba flamelloides]|uniref:Serine/threonine specific protein phosphatases domain-containing protein n=1 Tax=Anaeramoeba flamelloides TaxID=1746091 RepID=A0ABQ8ZCI2_9EUKA|nr:hypothetical protein M0813_12201 [Anaeramoeba flamelloides]
METFDCLPLAAIVDKHFFCVHGGLSPKLQKVETINLINRFQEPPTNGLYGDLLWSDPDPQYNQPKFTQKAFGFNHTRGCSYHYTFRAVSTFLRENKLTTVIRAHEAKPSGFLMYLKRKQTNFPSLITIFSAPNYLDLYGNKGAVLKYHQKSVTIKEFRAVGHPYYLPKFIDVFQWSIPFITDKISLVWETYMNLTSQHLLQNLQRNDSSKKKHTAKEELGKEETREEKQEQGEEGNEEKNLVSGNGNIKDIKKESENLKIEQKKQKKIINSNTKIFLDHKRGNIIKLKVLLISKLMFDFAKIRRQRDKQIRSKIHTPIKFRRTVSLMFNTVTENSNFSLFDQTNKGKSSYLRSQSVEDLAKIEQLKEQRLVTILKKSSIQNEKPIHTSQNNNANNVNGNENGNGSNGCDDNSDENSNYNMNSNGTEYKNTNTLPQINEINFITKSQNEDKTIQQNKLKSVKTKNPKKRNGIKKQFEQMNDHSIVIKSIPRTCTSVKSKKSHPLFKLNSFPIQENKISLSKQVHPKKEN